MRFNINGLNESFDRKFTEILTEAKQVDSEKFNEFYDGIITWEEFSKAEFKNRFKRLEEYQKGNILLACDWLPKHVSREEMSSLVDRANKRLEKSGMVEAEYENKEIPAPKHELKELLVMTDGEYKLYACDCVEDAIMLGRGSNWCHTGHNGIPKGYVKVSQAKQNFDDLQPKTKDGKFYFIYKNDQPLYALHIERIGTIYMKDEHDWSDSIDNYITKFPKICEYFGYVDWSNKIYYWDGQSSVPKEVVNVVIEDGVTSVGENAFLLRHALQSIEIPNSVTLIGDSAFWCCESLQSIEIPNSVTSMGEVVFSHCNKLTIYCNKGSYAEQYAIDNNIPYDTSRRIE